MAGCKGRGLSVCMPKMTPRLDSKFELTMEVIITHAILLQLGIL